MSARTSARRSATTARALPSPQPAPDVVVQGGGSVYLFFPMSRAATNWIAENVGEGAMWYGRGLAVEHRYAGELADGMVADGLVVA